MSVRPGPAQQCQVLREDPELSESIPPHRRAQAIERCTAREVDLPISGDAATSVEIAGTGIGLLLLDGLLIRRVGIEGRFGAELLGEGDLLRPWQDEDDSPTLPLQTAWSMIAPARAAVLDQDFVTCLGSYPELAAALVDRALKRSRNLAVNMAIVHQARVDARVHMMLWHLAGRWGRVRRDGTLLPLRLTHFVLAELVAARRQTVTTALSELARRGLVASQGDVWLLYGNAPVELLDVEAQLREPPVASQLTSPS